MLCGWLLFFGSLLYLVCIMRSGSLKTFGLLGDFGSLLYVGYL